ncbi:O-antigen ligase family protein [Kaistia dalseonensis]|uniref:O-antigen ligase n=1 Tax=Kaistia dalseonensis TaxID=410840 RepID=A0ABU0H321_9HYPH|nr:O-antigen ligase family protein [Kaistia dalseonensis]MCX5494124.1 O-antigen ligase family protein [Kaistia dalseonensis]MDQ0436703.1 O-antigen ligase [Kaistia dalseonensis]
MQRGVLAGANGLFFVLICMVLAFAPVPIGSNRPFFWELNAAIIAVMAFVYLIRLGDEPGRLRISLGDLAWPGAALGVAMLWMVVQVIPLPSWLAPAIWSDAQGALGYPIGKTISLDPAATVHMLLNYAAYALLFFLVVQVCANEDRAHRLLQVVFWSIAVHAAIGIVLLMQFGDTLLFLPKWAYHGVATGFFVNRNSFATFLAFGLAIGAALLVDALAPSRRSGQNRPFHEVFRLDAMIGAIGGYGTGMAIIGSALLLTASRMGAVVGVIGMLMPVLMSMARSRGRRVVLGLLAVALLAIALGLVLLSGAQLTDRLGSLETEDDERWELFRQTLSMIASRPLIGFGGGTFEDAFPLFHQIQLSADVVWDRAHNLYLELWTDLGIFALAPIASVGLIMAKMRYALGSGRSWAAGAAALTVCMIAAVHSLVDFSLQIEAVTLIFVAVMGSGYAQGVSAEVRQMAKSHAAGGLKDHRSRRAAPILPISPAPFGNVGEAGSP